ncbi:MAG: MFS transporter [Bifidobacterium sp.]|uniref:MFS transporter n=1 Tax=Bifidobacterium sp. TaxID=41200 RepID=UPI0039E83659
MNTRHVPIGKNDEAQNRNISQGSQMPNSAISQAQSSGNRSQSSAARTIAFAIIMVTVLVVSMDNSILYIVMKTLAQNPPTGLGASQSQLQWFSDAYILAYAGLLLTGGVAGNRFGHRRTLLIGLAGFGMFSLASSFAPTAGWLIGLRAMMGLFAAFLIPATLAIITYLFDGAARAKAIGIWSAVVGAALAIGPLAAGALLTHFWWGSVFLINPPVVLVALIAVPLLVPEYRDESRPSFDLPGMLLASAGLLGIIYGIIQAGDSASWTGGKTIAPIAAGLVAIIVFALWELRAKTPMLDVRYFTDRGFTIAALALALLFFSLFGGVFIMTFYLQSIRGYSALETGVCILPFALAMIAFAPQARKMAVRFSARVTSGSGMLVIAAATFALSRISQHTSIWVFEVLLFAFGAGMSLVMPPMTTRIVSTLPQSQAGTSSVVNNTFRQVGGSLGIAVLGSILAGHYRTAIEPRLTFLPAGIRSQVASSITATQQVAAHLSSTHVPAELDHNLFAQATDAFISAQQTAWTIGSIVALAAAILILGLYRDRKADSTQAE